MTCQILAGSPGSCEIADQDLVAVGWQLAAQLHWQKPTESLNLFVQLWR